MREDFKEDVMYYLQRSFPLFSSLILVFISYVPVDFSIFNNIRPSIGMICIYFWMIHRPDLFNLFSVFTIGLIDDTISSVPVGANILTYLVMYLLISNLSRFVYRKPFIITWYGFAAVILVAFAVKWLTLSIYYSQFLPLLMTVFSLLATIALYPFLSLILAFVQNNMIADEELQ